MPRRRNELDTLTLLVGKRARGLRGDRSVTTISRAANTKPSTISYLEDGITDVQVGTLESIASSLGVRITDLLNVDDSDHGAIYELLRYRPELVAELLVVLTTGKAA